MLPFIAAHFLALYILLYLTRLFCLLLKLRTPRLRMHAFAALSVSIIVILQPYHEVLVSGQGLSSWALRENGSCSAGESICGPTYGGFVACCPPTSPCQRQYNSICCPDGQSIIIPNKIQEMQIKADALIAPRKSQLHSSSRGEWTALRRPHI